MYMNNFIPEDYTEPSQQNNYLKLESGENRLRILSKPIFGYEDWIDKKPVRYQMNEKPESPHDESVPVKHFWAMVVWNYKEKEIQLWHVTQVSVRKRLLELYQDRDWGTPTEYDIKIMKTGEKMETKYSILPVSHKKVDPAIIDAFNKKPCNLDALFMSDDPFSSKWKRHTPCALDNTPVAGMDELIKMYEECDPTFQKSLMKSLGDLNPPVTRLQDVPGKILNAIREKIEKNRAEYKSLKRAVA